MKPNPWRVTLTYAVVAAAWIILSSWAVWGARLLGSSQALWETGKGLLFVGVTAALLHLLVSQWARQLLQKQRSLERSYQDSRDVNHRLDAVLNGSQDLIAAWDTDFILVACNHRYIDVVRRFFGREPAQGMSMPAFFRGYPAAREEFQACWQRTLAGEAFTVTQELSLGTAPHYFESSYAPLRDDSGRIRGGLHVARDVTDRIQSEHERQRQRNQLEEAVASLTEANADLERLAYVATHDLQEPLRSIVCFSEIVERSCADRLDGELREYLGYIRNGAYRMRDMLRDVLALSRCRRKPLHLVEIPADKACHDALAVLQDAIAANDARITLTPLPTVWADDRQLALVFEELIGNAVKFRRPDASPHILISCQDQDDTWEFRVADDGIGFDPAGRDVFEIFSRHHSGPAYPGTGMGLALCKTILANHGGRIFAESAPGRGAVFHFTLPKTPAPRPRPTITG